MAENNPRNNSIPKIKQRVLITGATGLLGRAVSKIFLADDNWEVLCVGLKRAKGQIMRVDLTDFDATSKLVETFKPHVIVHLAGVNDFDTCEKDPKQSELLNVEVTEHLAKLTKKHLAWLLICSTDNVFDGSAAPYTEGASMNPINALGRQKREAGMRAREADWGCGSLRLGTLYGSVERLCESEVTKVLETLLQYRQNNINNNNNNVNVVIDGKNVVNSLEFDDRQLLYPTLVDDVAVIAKSLAEQKMQHCGLSGVWNCAGQQGYTRLELARKLSQLMGWDSAHLKAAVVDADRRPRDCKLDISTLELMGFSLNTPLEKAFDACGLRELAK